MDNLLSIDRANNNTSIVFLLIWRGWRLLFAADAEQRSWHTMNKHGVLSPVDFYKVSHHASRTGLPPLEILDRILHRDPDEHRRPKAVVSTFAGVYNGLPDPATLDLLRSRRRAVAGRLAAGHTVPGFRILGLTRRGKVR